MSFGTISHRDIGQYSGRSDCVMIDVRDETAYRHGHIHGAVNIPYKKLMQMFWRMPSDKIYIVYCEHGGTSLMAARRMAECGYEVLSVVGGFLACGQHQKRVY